MKGEPGDLIIPPARQGPKGPKGNAGFSGRPGIDGNVGGQGSRGLPGLPGPVGLKVCSDFVHYIIFEVQENYEIANYFLFAYSLLLLCRNRRRRSANSNVVTIGDKLLARSLIFR